MRSTYYLDQSTRKVEAIRAYMEGKRNTKHIAELEGIVDQWHYAQAEVDYEEACRQWMSDILDVAMFPSGDDKFTPTTAKWIKRNWCFDRDQRG